MTLPFKQLLLSVDRLDNPPRKTVNDYLEDAPYPFIADGLMQAIIDEGVLVRLTLLPFNKYQHGLQDVYVSLRTEGLIDKFYIRDGNSYTALDQDDNDIWQTSLAPYIVSMYVINYNTMLEHEIVNIDVNITPTPSPTPTISNTPTPSVTQSVTVTPSTTPSVSITAPETVTPTPTSSLTPTPGSSLTPTPTTTKSLTPSPSVTPTQTPAGPELVINGTFSSGSSVPTQFSGTNCTLSINTGQMILSATANLGGPPSALLNVTGLTMTTIQSYRVMFDYIQGTTNLHFLNVKITDGTTTYYTTSTNLTGNGTFNQVVQFPAGTTRILVTMSPTDTTTGLSNTVYVAQQYPFDNFSIKRVL